MSLEERIEFHEQMSRSIESNLHEVVEEQARLAEAQTRQEKAQAQLTEGLVQLTQVVLRLGERQAVTEASLAALADEHRRLEGLIQQYIRFRGDGKQPG